jgi:hypothetical protein
MLKKLKAFLPRRIKKILRGNLRSAKSQAAPEKFDYQKLPPKSESLDLTRDAWPIIDYSSHAAFKDLTSPKIPSEGAEIIAGHVENLERLLNFSSTNSMTLPALKGWAQEVVSVSQSIDRTFFENTDKYLAKFFFSRALDFAVGQILYNSFITNSKGTAKLSAVKNISDLTNLQNGGFTGIRLSSSARNRLRIKAAPYLEELRGKVSIPVKGRTVTGIDTESELGVEITNLVNELGISELFSAHLGVPVDYWGSGIELTTDQHLWWQNCYADVGLSIANTAYMHADHGDFSPKVMLYLSEVTPETGPTRFVKASNTWKRSEYFFQFHKGLDHVAGHFIGNLMPGDYYRPLYKFPEFREILMSFPKGFVGTSHFGDDIMNDSAESRRLISQEFTLLSEKGDLIAFDGGRGIHRGSNILLGERLAAQLIFMPKQNNAANSFASQILNKNFRITD